MHGIYKREADEHLRKKDYDKAMEAYTSVRLKRSLFSRSLKSLHCKKTHRSF